MISSSEPDCKPASLSARLFAASLLATGFVAPATAQTRCNASNIFKLGWGTVSPKARLGTGTRTYIVINAVGAVVTVTMSFAGDTTHYTESTNGQIHDISFCRMPAVGIAKTSSPVSIVTTDPNRFNIPVRLSTMTLRVTIAGGSTVDLGTALITDALPANVTFFNGDIDPALPGAQNYLFTPETSGPTLGPTNIPYHSSANGSITPATDYDLAVRSLHWLPQGTMAANRNFNIRFRALIN